MLSYLYRLLARIQAVFRSADCDRDLEFELEAHVQLLTEDHILRGRPQDEAERLARIELGGVYQLQEAHREIRALPFLDTLRQDLGYAFRILRHNPGFTAFIILIVGLGVGVSSTIFSVVNTLLLRPLPFSDSRQLVWIANLADDGVSEWNTQVGHFLDLRERNRSFSDIAAYFTSFQPGDAKVIVDGQTERLGSLQVSQNFFSLLGISPLTGQNFHRGGMQMERSRRGGAELWLMETALCLRSGYRRQNRDSERRARDDCGRRSPLLRFRDCVRAGQSHRRVSTHAADAGNQPMGQYAGSHWTAEAGRHH